MPPRLQIEGLFRQYAQDLRRFWTFPWHRQRSRLDEAVNMLSHGDASTKALLLTSVRSPFSTEDAAAALLGQDLWLKPLRDYRDYLLAFERRPHLWSFDFGPSATWPSETWRSLYSETRMVRSRLASPARECDIVVSSSTIDVRPRMLHDAMQELQHRGLADALGPGFYRLYAIAAPSALDLDLHLSRIIGHWLTMLAYADLVAADKTPQGYEVCGYDEACRYCRIAWGIRPRASEWVPPFHPGCRCYAQPRFVAL